MNITKLIPVLSLITFVSSVAQADCKALYNEKIKRLDGMLNPARTLMVANGTTAAAVPTALAIAGANITVGAVVAAPAVLVGVGTYFGVLAVKKKSYEKTLRMIVAAEKLNTKDRLTVKLAQSIARSNPGMTVEKLQSFIADSNKSKAFCLENPVNGKIQLLNFRKFKNYVRASFAAEEESVTSEE